MATSLTFGVGGERLGGRAGAAAAAADQADPQHVAAGRVHVRQRGQRAGDGGGLEEVAAGWSGGRHGGSSHFFKRVQLELADEQLEPFRLQQDLAAPRGRRRSTR